MDMISDSFVNSCHRRGEALEAPRASRRRRGRRRARPRHRSARRRSGCARGPVRLRRFASAATSFAVPRRGGAAEVTISRRPRPRRRRAARSNCAAISGSSPRRRFSASSAQEVAAVPGVGGRHRPPGEQGDELVLRTCGLPRSLRPARPRTAARRRAARTRGEGAALLRLKLEGGARVGPGDGGVLSHGGLLSPARARRELVEQVACALGRSRAQQLRRRRRRAAADVAAQRSRARARLGRDLGARRGDQRSPSASAAAWPLDGSFRASTPGRRSARRARAPRGSRRRHGLGVRRGPSGRGRRQRGRRRSSSAAPRWRLCSGGHDELPDEPEQDQEDDHLADESGVDIMPSPGRLCGRRASRP
jgi:hypothetical protein